MMDERRSEVAGASLEYRMSSDYLPGSLPAAAVSHEPHHHYLGAHGLDLHYVATDSDRPPMLLLHGIGMDWRVWQAISRRLAHHFHLYMPDLRGHGLSGKPASGYALADYAWDIELLLDQLGLQDVTLVGSSLGGMVTVVIEADVNVVARRVLVDPPLKRGAGPTRPLFQEILEIKHKGRSEDQEQQLILNALRADNPNAGRLYLKYMAETWARAAPGVLREALSPAEDQDEIEAALSAIEVPTLIMRGNPARGSALKPRDAGRALQLLPRGTEEYFEGSGHAIHGSEPVKFVDAILRFSPTSAPQEVSR